jgi:hypothetical protein
MKTVFLLLMAMLVVKTTSAQGQEVCSKSYISCVDQCVAKPSASLQGTCIESCQSQNNVCAAKVYGADNTSTAKSVTPEEVAERDEAKAAKPAAKAAKQAAPARQMAAPARQERRPQ